MKAVFLALCALSAATWALWLALPWLLSLRGVEMRRRGLWHASLVFEAPDEDGTPVRLLNVDGTFQSAAYATEPLWSELVCVYHREMVRVVDAMADAREVLVIGGGGYALPTHLVTHTRRMRVTVVEIDPEMTSLARERFYLARAEELAGERLELVCADGWEWLRTSGRHFDVIVNDAFMGSRPLGALSTAEGARLVARHLSERGVYLANVRCPLEGFRARPLREVRDAFARAFTMVEVLPERPEEPRRPANNVLVATNRELAL